MKILQTVAQHRSVSLLEDVRSDLDDVVGADAEDVHVERGVMDLVHAEVVGIELDEASRRA